MAATYLTHYSRRPEDFMSILARGLAYVPNTTKVFSDLVGVPDLPEPMSYGMVSFTDTPPEYGSGHRKLYGDYGVCVEKGWAKERGATKVLYVHPASPVGTAFKSLFSILRPQEPTFQSKDGQVVELPQFFRDHMRTLRETDKRWAEMSSPGYAQLLKLHEYMQSELDVAESEWRIISKCEVDWGGTERTPEKIKSDALEIAMQGVIKTLKLDPRSLQLICPEDDVHDLRRELPPEWSSVVIRSVARTK